jgi:hypothetical protein
MQYQAIININAISDCSITPAMLELSAASASILGGMPAPAGNNHRNDNHWLPTVRVA